MTTISAKIVADSLSPDGIRLTTMQLRYPRPIHAEFLTHRVFSRNASSSRAIPVERLIQDVIDDPYVPLHWGKNQKGMQAHEETNAQVPLTHFQHTLAGIKMTTELVDRDLAWLSDVHATVRRAREWSAAGYHKQIVNRILEPYAHINVVATSTEWANFLWLRDHPDAEPHIAILAQEMKMALAASVPRRLGYGDWHLPYVNQGQGSNDSAAVWEYAKKHDLDLMDVARRLSVARCASVSYKTVDGQEMTLERATDLFDKLITAEPLHASPTEHQAKPDQKMQIWNCGVEYDEWAEPELHGNLKGWIQFRKTLPNENYTS